MKIDPLTCANVVERGLRERIATLEAELAEERYWRTEMTLAPQEHQHVLANINVRFSPSERAVLGYLLHHIGNTVPRHALLAVATPFCRDRTCGPNEKSIDVYITHIRKRLDFLRKLGFAVEFTITTVWGVGYCALPSPTSSNGDTNGADQRHEPV